MKLPESVDIPINLLAACFNKTNSTYKYYWFLSILQEVENSNYFINKSILFARMVSNAWYTVNYFHVSFGKQDLIQQAIDSIREIERISIDEKLSKVLHKLANSPQRKTLNQLWHFDNNVPHWFLSPWFPKVGSETDSARQKRIYKHSQIFESKCLYALYNEQVEINPLWIDYLTSNIKLLKDYCYWNLALFLQSKNPNVPDIPNKLIKPALRNSLTNQRKNFWDIVLKHIGTVKCIYTGKELTIENYAVEHFIPYNFVSHDLVWNLIPADKSFNSKKSDKLPTLEKYFGSFYKQQKLAFDIIREKSPNNKLLQDYLTIMPEFNYFSEEKLRETIAPLITIASNNGFEFI
jgi:hypothetical protein